MSLPYFKADTDGYLEAMSAMEWKATPPRSLMHTEVKAVVAGDVMKRWSISRWARRWSCSRNLVRAVLAEVAEWQDDWGGEEWGESRRALFFARYLPPKAVAKTVTKEPEEAQDGDTPGTPQGQGMDTPGTGDGQGEPDANDIVDEHGTPQGQGKDTPGTGTGHPRDTIARGSSETGDRRRSPDSPKPPPPSAEGASPSGAPQGQLALTSPVEMLSQVEAMLHRLKLSRSAVKAPARQGLADAGLVSERQIAALGPKQLRAEATDVGLSTAKALRRALERAGYELADDPKEDTRARRMVGGIWAGLWQQRTGAKYDWRWKRNGNLTSDEEHAQGLAHIVNVKPDDGEQQEPLHRLHKAMDAYLTEVDAGRVFGIRLPTFADFAKRAQVYLQVADGDTGAVPAAQQGGDSFDQMARVQAMRAGLNGRQQPNNLSAFPTLKVVT